VTFDGKLLAKARLALEEKRRLHEEKQLRRTARVYAQLPRVREIDDMLRATMVDLLSAALTPYGKAKIEEIRCRNLDLQAERRAELRRAGFADGFLDSEYYCENCRDTGLAGQELCRCLLEQYKLAQRQSLSNLLKMGGETFKNFNLSYYEDTDGISPRKNMEVIYETAREYARKFGEKSMNLFFNGAPGLGKTFLSACIARVVSENGFSVVYDTAVSIFSKFEDAKFLRAEDTETARGEARRCLECDLLIFDDLGTEMTTAFTQSALYEIINTRLVTGKKTIISSNLTPDELRRRYSEQVVSRLEGEYQVLTFRGEDIRKLKNG